MFYGVQGGIEVGWIGNFPLDIQFVSGYSINRDSWRPQTMKIRALVLLFFCFLMAQTAFGDILTGCVDGPNLSDGSGGFFAQYSCTLYREPGVYPFSLEPYFDVPAADIPENYLGPGYIVFSSDATDVTNQTLTDPAAFQDILFFNNDVAAGTLSDEVQLYWSGSGFPSAGTISSFLGGGDYSVLPWSRSGTQVFTSSISPDVSFTVIDTPEPTSFLLLFTAGLGALIVRRRRA
jgi:hypothetical protein